MRRNHRVENRDDQQYMGPDCSVCALRSGCPNKEDGSFCTRFRRNEPEDRGPSPADQWAKGD